VRGSLTESSSTAQQPSPAPARRRLGLELKPTLFAALRPGKFHGAFGAGKAKLPFADACGSCVAASKAASQPVA